MKNFKYFKTDGIRGKVGKKPITPDFMLKLGQIIGTILGEYKKKLLLEEIPVFQDVCYSIA